MLERIEFNAFADLAKETWSDVQGLVVFLGENGAGKSRLLARIEQQSVRAGRVPLR